MPDPSPAAPTTTAKAEAKGTARALGLVSIAILCSRLLGLVREIIISMLFADKANLRWLDCFNMAFRAPNMLRDLFAEGALSTAFVTVFAKKAATDGDEAAWSLARKIASLTTVWMTLVSALGVLFSPWIIWLMASGWRNPSDPKNLLSAEDLQAKLDFTIMLTRIMFPFILLVSLAALVMGMLNARKVFFMPAMASTFFNVASMLVGGIVGWWLDPAFGKTAIIGFAVGVLVGGLAQLGAQLPSLKKVGFRFGIDLNWKDPGVKQTLDLMWPAVISGSVVQINVLLNANFASYVAGDGPVTWLNNAFRLMQLPLGLFGVGLATVSLPSLARMAANGITQDFRDTLSKAIRMGTLLSMPSAVGLIMLAYPIMSLLYGNGRAATNPAHVPGCAVALQTYAIGLVFYSGLKVLQPAFYAIDKRFIPMVVSLICVLFTAISNYLFVVHWHLDHRYLALSTSLSAALNFGCLFFAMRHHAGRFGGRKLVLTFAKVSIAALCMAGACWAAQQTLLAHWNDPVLPGESRAAWLALRAFLLGVTITISAAVYFGVSALLKNEELGDFTGSLKRKFKRK